MLAATSTRRARASEPFVPAWQQSIMCGATDEGPYGIRDPLGGGRGFLLGRLGRPVVVASTDVAPGTERCLTRGRASRPTFADGDARPRSTAASSTVSATSTPVDGNGPAVSTCASGRRAQPARRRAEAGAPSRAGVGATELARRFLDLVPATPTVLGARTSARTPRRARLAAVSYAQVGGCAGSAVGAPAPRGAASWPTPASAATTAPARRRASPTSPRRAPARQTAATAACVDLGVDGRRRPTRDQHPTGGCSPASLRPSRSGAHASSSRFSPTSGKRTTASALSPWPMMSRITPSPHLSWRDVVADAQARALGAAVRRSGDRSAPTTRRDCAATDRPARPRRRRRPRRVLAAAARAGRRLARAPRGSRRGTGSAGCTGSRRTASGSTRGRGRGAPGRG